MRAGDAPAPVRVASTAFRRSGLPCSGRSHRPEVACQALCPMAAGLLSGRLPIVAFSSTALHSPPAMGAPVTAARVLSRPAPLRSAQRGP